MERTERPAARRAYDTVADALVAAGVRCIFGVLGEDTAPLMVAAVARGIAYHAARHESQAVAMADGYARASGQVGVATVTGGPGFTNALTAINTAHRAGSRVAILIGAGRAAEDDHAPGTVREVNGPSWTKYFPQSAVMELVGIPVVRPLTADRAAAEAARAMTMAERSTTVLVLGRALLLGTVTADGDDAAGRTDTLPNGPALDAAKIGELADLLQETWAVRRPLILAGHGAVAAGAGPALRRLGAQTGAVLATTLRARGLFSGDPHAIGVCGTYSTPVATELLTQADCVLAFGASLNPWTTYGNTLFPKAMLVQVDRDPEAIGRFLPEGFGIQGDVRTVAEALVTELDRRGHIYEGYRSAPTRHALAAHRKDADVVDRSTSDRIDPRTLMLALDQMLPAGRVLCVDAGQQARFAIRYIDTQRPANFMQALDAGALGLGLGVAIGAAVGRPDDLVVAAVGDGGAMMALGDLESAARLRLPMLIVVSNDESFGAEVNVLAALNMDTRLADVPCPSFEALALAMGARAATVRSLGDLDVVRAWLDEPRGQPLVLDCRVNPAVRAD